MVMTDKEWDRDKVVFSLRVLTTPGRNTLSLGTASATSPNTARFRRKAVGPT